MGGVTAAGGTVPLASGVVPSHVATARPGAPSSPHWTIAALGDSVVSGTHCDCAPFVDRYADLVARATGGVATAHNLGVPGLTTDGLLTQLVDGSTAARTVSHADIVTLTIGANDMGSARARWQAGTCVGCFAAVAATVRANTAKILSRIRQLRRGARTEVLVTTYWNVFEETGKDSPEGPDYGPMAEDATRRTNTAVCRAAAAGGAACIDLYRPFKGDGSADPTDLLADDGDHPDAAGHQLIAATLAAHGWRELGVAAGR
ncbi:MAG: SGNH/GDSL hydrolase family protein [Actinomycetes bacterium]